MALPDLEQLDTTTATGVERFLAQIERARVLQRVDDAVLAPLARALDDPQLTSLLSGTWYGHPIHPPLTDVPIGAWTNAAVLDLLPGRWSRRPADLLIAMGVVAAVPTVATGLNDWRDTGGGTRRIGVAHALTNAVAVLLYLWSLLRRARGRRASGVLLSLLGLGTVTVGGFLGGHLAYRKGVGVDENAFAGGPSEWTAVLAFDDLPDRQLTRATVDGLALVLYRNGGGVYALAERCSHLGGPLSEGQVLQDEGLVRCPWHHSTFRLADGTVVRGPASAPQLRFETRVCDGQVEVRGARSPIATAP